VKKEYGDFQIPRSGFKNRENGLEFYLAGKEGYGRKGNGSNRLEVEERGTKWTFNFPTSRAPPVTEWSSRF
jgi:hypothetical protein